jgi:hypothetical protein
MTMTGVETAYAAMARLSSISDIRGVGMSATMRWRSAFSPSVSGARERGGGLRCIGRS